MPTEEPDSTSCHTVENGLEEPSEDRATSAHDPIPSAPPSLSGWTPGEADLPNKIKSIPSGEARSSDASARVCCTNVVHNRPFDDELRRCDARVFHPSDCCTSVVHKPSERPTPPSPRTAPRSRRQQSGLILRGRVFYLRLRVPRSVQETFGRTHLWRSLGSVRGRMDRLPLLRPALPHVSQQSAPSFRAPPPPSARCAPASPPRNHGSPLGS